MRRGSSESGERSNRAKCRRKRSMRCCPQPAIPRLTSPAPMILGSLIEDGPPAPALYFALPPAVAVSACRALQQLSTPLRAPSWRWRSHSVPTKRARRASTTCFANLVPETRVHRIDHFLGPLHRLKPAWRTVREPAARAVVEQRAHRAHRHRLRRAASRWRIERATTTALGHSRT